MAAPHYVEHHTRGEGVIEKNNMLHKISQTSNTYITKRVVIWHILMNMRTHILLIHWSLHNCTSLHRRVKWCIATNWYNVSEVRGWVEKWQACDPLDTEHPEYQSKLKKHPCGSSTNVFLGSKKAKTLSCKERVLCESERKHQLAWALKIVVPTCSCL